MKMKKRFLGILLSLVMVLGLMPGMGLPARADGTVTTEADLQSALSASGTATITLGADINITSTLTINGNKNLNLNGHGIRMTGTDASVITVEESAVFTMDDSKKNSTDDSDKHYYKVNNSTHLAEFCNNEEGSDGYFVGGYITGGNIRQHDNEFHGGAGVWVYGQFTLNGGTIIGNKADYTGGGVLLRGNTKSVFTMNGGEISYNTAKYGGGICVDMKSSKPVAVNINGGTIKNNYASEVSGALHMKGQNNADSTLIIHGGVITGNMAKIAPGILLETLNAIKLSGSPVIKGNTASGTENNLDFKTSNSTNMSINIDGKLDENASIGITGKSGVFTSGYAEKGNSSLDPKEVFIYDQGGYIAVWDSSKLEAEFKKSYTVTFSSNGGSAVDPQTVAEGSVVEKPDDPTKDGYTLDGWYNDEALNTKWDFDNDTVSSNTALYAKWSSVPATAPTISNVTGATLTVGYAEGSISVTATAATDTTYNALAYQWYSNTTASNQGGSAIEGATDSSYAIDTGKNAGTTEYYYCVVTATRTDNSETAAATSGVATVSITDKNIQTVTAADVTATYGDTDKSVSGSTDGDGEISYAVKDGSGDYIDVNATTGALTIKKVPADGKAYVTVTAAETATYAQATKEVTVTINKANAVAATVTANNRTYDGTEQPLVTVTGTPTGGEMQYALGTATEATEQYTTSIPAKTDAGTYYVWYKVKGNENHNDADPKVVTVKIATPSTYTVTVTDDGHGTGAANPASGVTGTEVTLTNTPAEGYQFKEWQVISGGVTVTDNKLIIGTANVEVKAVFEALPEGSETGDTQTVSGAPAITDSNMADVVKSVVEAIQNGKLENAPANIEEIKLALAQSGAKVTLTLVSKPLADGDVPAADKTALNEAVQANGYDGYQPFDLTLQLTVTDPATGNKVSAEIHVSSKEVTFSLQVPENLRKQGRTFYLLHVSGGKVTILDSKTGDTLTGKSQNFSTYAIAYQDAAEPVKSTFYFRKVWEGSTEKSIDFTLYSADGKVVHQGFDKRILNAKEWSYSAVFKDAGSCYIIEKPIPGYITRYVNVGEYAGITDRCCNGGTIINKRIPKTGDETPLLLWAGMLLTGAAGLTVALTVNKRRKAHR